MFIKHHNLPMKQVSVVASITGLSIAGLCLLLLPHSILWAIIFGLTGACIAYYIIRQQDEIEKLRVEIQDYQAKDETFLHHAKDLHDVLHDLRNSMGSVKLSIQVLQRVSCDEDQRHLNRMEESLESALEQLILIADMHKEDEPPRQLMGLELNER